jgi:hypothetical protein
MEKLAVILRQVKSGVSYLGILQAQLLFQYFSRWIFILSFKWPLKLENFSDYSGYLKNLCETSSLAIVENVTWEKHFNI